MEYINVIKCPDCDSNFNTQYRTAKQEHFYCGECHLQEDGELGYWRDLPLDATTTSP